MHDGLDESEQEEAVSRGGNVEEKSLAGEISGDSMLVAGREQGASKNRPVIGKLKISIM